MSPYRLCGPQCKENGCVRPVFEQDWCRLHYELAAAFGYADREPEPPALTEIVVPDYQSHEFARQLRDWLEAA